MAAITPLAEHDLEALLSRYALSGLQRFWPATNGIENSNYFIRLAGEDLAGQENCRELVLTMLERPAHAGDLLVPLLDHCDAAGLPVARVVRNRAGDANDEINGKPTILSPRLCGQHVINPTLRHCESVGQFLARFHLVAEPMALGAPTYPRDIQWLARTAELVQPTLRFADAELLNAALSTVTSLLDRSDAANLPHGIIHGDLFRDNVLFTEHGLSGVLDFHHAAAGCWIYDVAVAANDWCSVGDGTLDNERVMSLLRSYHRVRPLQLPELWFFPVFALYAALAFWLSRLEGLRTADERGRTKNPDEFRRIVQGHMNRFFYLDPRLLH
jgi:homoserine kinase type II